MLVLIRHLNTGLALAWLCLGGEQLFISWWFFRGFAAIVGAGWLVWLLNYLRSSSQGCIRTSELYFSKSQEKTLLEKAQSPGSAEHHF